MRIDRVAALAIGGAAAFGGGFAVAVLTAGSKPPAPPAHTAPPRPRIAGLEAAAPLPPLRRPPVSPETVPDQPTLPSVGTDRTGSGGTPQTQATAPTPPTPVPTQEPVTTSGS